MNWTPPSTVVFALLLLYATVGVPTADASPDVHMHFLRVNSNVLLSYSFFHHSPPWRTYAGQIDSLRPVDATTGRALYNVHMNWYEQGVAALMKAISKQVDIQLMQCVSNMR
jgi:hypothetical protein